MFRGKANTVIGLTVCHGEYLGVSVPAVAKLSGDYLLVVNNTNPDQTITTRAIRKMGYRGRLHIINSTACSGVLSARMAIMDAARNIMPNAEWIVFINDCDILVDCRAPHVLENNFAIIQNAVSTRGQLLNVLRLMGTGDWRTLPDGDVQLLRPHVGMSGTLVRFDAACQMCSVLRRIYDIISASCDCVGDIPAADAVMWAALNHIMHHTDTAATPIYMDGVNYIHIDVDGASAHRAPVSQLARLTDECIAVINRIVFTDIENN